MFPRAYNLGIFFNTLWHYPSRVASLGGLWTRTNKMLLLLLIHSPELCPPFKHLRTMSDGEQPSVLKTKRAGFQTDSSPDGLLSNPDGDLIRACQWRETANAHAAFPASSGSTGELSLCKAIKWKFHFVGRSSSLNQSHSLMDCLSEQVNICRFIWWTLCEKWAPLIFLATSIFDSQVALSPQLTDCSSKQMAAKPSLEFSAYLENKNHPILWKKDLLEVNWLINGKLIVLIWLNGLKALQ